MAYQYLTPENLVETFRTSQKYTEKLTDRFPEFERTARNKPHASIPKEYPKTTDGTTASIIRKTPHRIIQQLPTGKVKCDYEDWISIIAQFIYTSKIIPNANEGYALLQKCWQVVERFLTFGACPTYAPSTMKRDGIIPDLTLPYWGDIFLQPGKLSDSDSNYFFLRSWWQTADIDALIDQQSKLDPKKRTWDVEALKLIRTATTTKDEKAKTPAERDAKTNEEGGVQLITGFQKGVKSKFYTFHIQSTGQGKGTTYQGTIVRTKVNKDPRGEFPISFAYGDMDGSNPMGRSIIDLVGALQNLMDAEMQMYQYNRALMLNPPLIKRGNFNKNKVKFAPNVIIDVGSSENANVEPLTIDSTAIANFPNNYGLMKSQMLNLLASPDTSISAEAGNPGFSKTPQGVELSKANLSIDDNYVRKQFETWFERWSETAINLYFAERTGTEELQLDDETIEELMELAKKGKFDPQMISEDGKIRINYDDATPALRFEVDASTSKKQDEVQQLQSYQGIVTLLDKSPFLQQIVPPQKQMELWNALVDNSGAEDQEKLKVSDQELQKILQDKANQPPQQPREFLPFKDIAAVAPLAAAAMLEQAGLPSDELKQRAPQPVEDPNAKNAGQADPGGLTPEHVMKVHDQAHKQEMDKAKLALEAQKVAIQQQQVDNQAKAAKAQAVNTAAQTKKAQ